MADGRPWPRLSIVTPSFNQGVFVEAAIRSVLLQGYPRVELVVVDGGSTDGSVATIEKYGPWLTRWASEKDHGPAHALNKGFRLTNGEILGFLNADDYLLPGSLARVAREFRLRPSADVISGHGYHARPSGEIGIPIFSDRWDPQRFAYGACVLVQQATFFKQRVFEETPGFNESLRTSWDMELWAELAAAGARFHLLDEFLAVFRLHQDSLTGNRLFGEQARQDIRGILRKVRGRKESTGDAALQLFHRLRKFSTHPRRTLGQRMFLYSALGRWSM
jgi:glycosyltransferase involved in cell wall biosynthesis